MKEYPLVSVVIPFYSGVDWLIEAINSALEQTYKNLEVLVINDGSKENLEKVKKKFKTTIRIINKENGGPASARNLGIEKSNGKYIAFLDSDDTWYKDKLTNQILSMETNKYIWSHHSYKMFWDDKNKTKVINTSVYVDDIYIDCFISLKIQTSCVVVLRKVLIENNIKFPLEKRYGQDLTFYKRIAKRYPIGYIDGIYSGFRIRGTNAGLRAKIQINDRAFTWQEVKDNSDLLRQLPPPIIFAYKISNKFNELLKLINQKYVKKEKNIELLSKFFYLIPYTIFKFYAKKV